MNTLYYRIELYTLRALLGGGYPELSTYLRLFSPRCYLNQSH